MLKEQRSRESSLPDLRHTALMILFLLLALPLHADEQSLFRNIHSHVQHDRTEDIRKAGAEFLRAYPASPLVPKVRFLMALYQEDPRRALGEFHYIRTSYPSFDELDRVQFHICELQYLTGQWVNLEKEARYSISKYKRSSLYLSYHFFLSLSLLYQRKYDESEQVAEHILEISRSTGNRGRAHLLTAHTSARTLGYSREFIHHVMRVFRYYEGTPLHPASMMLTGLFHEAWGKYSEAWSAYTDLIRRYPRSPEALKARHRIETIPAAYRKEVEYMPDEKMVKETDAFMIRPARPVTEDTTSSRMDYVLYIGPYPSQQRAQAAVPALKGYGRIRIIQMRFGYIILLGEFNSTDEAMSARVRLSEEQDIESRIVRVQKSDSRYYIYGE